MTIQRSEWVAELSAHLPTRAASPEGPVMTNQHSPGSSTVYHEPDVAASAQPQEVDGEAPGLLATDQLQRHTAAVVGALRAVGLAVWESDDDYPRRLRIEHPTDSRGGVLWLDEDRGAAWEIYNDAPAGSSSVAIAHHFLKQSGDCNDEG